MRLGKELLAENVKNLYMIGTVGLAPKPVIVNNNLHNIPSKGTFDASYHFWQPCMGDRWFFKK